MKKNQCEGLVRTSPYSWQFCSSCKDTLLESLLSNFVRNSYLFLISSEGKDQNLQLFTLHPFSKNIQVQKYFPPLLRRTLFDKPIPIRGN